MENQPGRDEVIVQGAGMIRGLNLFSDIFMSTVFRDRSACEYVLKKILVKEDLELTKVLTQWRLLNLTSKDSILDVFAENERDNCIYNLEDQRKDTREHAKRTRYYTAMIDKSSLDKGMEYDKLPDVYIIYLTETDVLESGLTVCEIEQKVKGTGKQYLDGTHKIYVNAEVDDGSEVAEMMRYFRTADPEDMSQGELSRRVRYLKSEKGAAEMCEVSEWIYNEGKKAGELEGRNEGRNDEKRAIALQMSRNGERLDYIAETVNVGVEHVREWVASAVM